MLNGCFDLSLKIVNEPIFQENNYNSDECDTWIKSDEFRINTETNIKFQLQKYF